MNYAASPQANRFASFFSASALSATSFAGLIALMAPPVVQMMAGA